MTRMIVNSRARPGPISGPAQRTVSAFTPPSVFDRWDGGIRALAPAANVIPMLDVIGEDFWSGGGITAKKVAAQLAQIGDADVEVHLNSPGGDFFEGIAIYNLLRDHPQQVTIKVMGVAASAASIIAMAGDVVEIAASGFIMIHNTWVMAYGNRNELRDVAAWLEPFDAASAEVYAARTGQPLADVVGWLDAETWMNGSLAVERGFADSLLAADAVTHDAGAAASARDVSDIRAMELQLVAAGATRSEARSRINKIKGTPGAALTPTPGAGDNDWVAAAAQLLQTMTR